MCKKLKIKFIIAIIAIIFLALVIPSIKNESLAVGLKDTSNVVEGTYPNRNWSQTSWKNLVKQGHAYILSSFFENNYTFCIALGQKIYFGEGNTRDMLEYNIKKVTIDGSTNDNLNGLAYILSQSSKRDTSNGWTNYENDPIQLALWCYISKNKPAGFPEQGEIGIKEKSYIEGKNNSGKKVGGKNKAGKDAYEIFKAANDKKNGTTRYIADVYILTNKTNNKYQTLMLVEDTDTVSKEANLKVKINKTVDKGNPEKKFQFRVDFKEGNTIQDAKTKKTITKFIDKDEAKVFSYKADTTKNVYVVITETSRDEDYTAAKQITIKYVYDGKNNKWKYVNMWGDTESLATFGQEKDYVRYDKNGEKNDRRIIRWKQGDTVPEFEIKVENKYVGKPTVKLCFLKTDISGNNNLEGAKITIKGAKNSNIESIKYWVSNEKGSGDFSERQELNLTSGESGYFRESSKDGRKIRIKPDDNNKAIWLYITETKAPEGYHPLSNGQRTLKVTYDKSSGKVKNVEFWNSSKNCSDGTLNFEVNSDGYAEIKIKNDSQIDKLEILKTDLDNNKLDGAQFKLTLTNIASIKKYQDPTIGKKQDSPKTIYVTTNKNGNIILEDLVIKDPAKEVEITIEETKEASNHKRINGEIKLIITKNGNSYNVSAEKDSTVLDEEFKTNDVKVNGHSIALNIKNISSITLSGQVWLDGQQGEKVISSPNGLKDSNESGIDGVNVYLYSIKGATVIKTTKTSNGGKYEFVDVPKTAEGYRIQFEYNGILYDDVGITGNSKAEENSSERNALNENFKTIDVNGANGSKYGEYNASYFKNYVDGSQPERAKIKAYTNVYKDTTSNIDCGLVEKYFDLAAGTDLSSARVAINGKDKTYTYAQVLNGELQKDLQAFQGTSANADGVKYNLYLYKSDYNYRIGDYKTDEEAITNKVNPDDNKENNYDNKQELEVYVTYSVVLQNQSMHNATVTKFEYTYDDEVFEPDNIISTDKYEVKINKNKITFTSNGDGLSINAPDYRNQIDLTFKVKKDNNGNLTLKDNCTNTVEILEYRTDEGGLIDIDSVPGNGTNNNEDDYDKAPALNIAVDDRKVRTIEGTVFEDKNKNGSNDDSEPVNDVIVQLIELKTIRGDYYEYIWQETRSGSNIVKTTSRNGYTGKEYTSDASGDGTYQFKDFIPGNYIIRFIYGDGSTYDITPKVQQYNGQDYKSTIDNSYKEEWYNQANYNGKSVARDNEARRLEVMAYSTTIKNDEKSEAINKKTKEMLDATWMCAETSKVKVEVEGDNTSYANMNFGLALRPRTKLTLEKHITGLKITPQGTGSQPIVDAKIVNGQIQGITTGLARMPSTRRNRGFWKVETDIEELAQGATVELEYTYTIKNESDEDYLSSTLIEAYKNQTDKTYDRSLLEIRDTIKQQMRKGNYSYSNNNNIGEYLGQYYYNNNSTGLAPVLSTVNVIEDNLNNNLKLVEETDMKFEKVNDAAEGKPVYDDAGNEKTEKIETVIRNKEATEALAKGGVDSTRTVKLTTTLSSSNKEISYPAYIGEIVEYTNAAGRKDMEATPGNLSYVHSENTGKTMENSNEHDEFWGETLMVSKPTGENKQAPMQIVIIAISSIAVIGVGIILIKKYVLK